MKSLILSALVALMLTPFTMAFQDEPAAQEQDPSLAAYQKIMKAHNDKVMEFRTKMREIKDSKERRAFYDKNYPQDGPVIAELKKIMAAHPKSDGAFASASWVMRRSRGPEKKAAMEVLSRDFIGKKGIGEVAFGLSRDRSMAAKNFLEQIMTQNTNREDQGKACFALAKWYKSGIDMASTLNSDNKERIAGLKKFAEAEMLDFVKSTGAEALEKKSVAHFERSMKEFGDVPYLGKRTLAMAAKGDLFEMQNLSIGKTAPEITAEDIDGVTFSLSDYRGKVVVLDFWGDW